MRVLMTADTAGGVWTYAIELSQSLEQSRVEVVLAALGPTRPEAEVPWFDCALEWMPDPWADVERSGEWLLELADEVRPDLVHVNGYAHAALDWRVPVVCVAHSDVCSWFEAVRGRPAPREWRRYRTLVAAGLQSADVVVSPTAAQLTALERHYGFETDRLVIPNGCRPLEPLPKEPLVAAAGRAWDEAKNFAALERLRIPWRIEVATGTRRRREVEALLGRAAIFVAPARYEPFGLAALEAASAGCALVLGDIPSLREVWRDAALFVDPGDDAQLGRTLTALIDDEPLLRGFARRARQRALELSPERMRSAYHRLYERLCVAEQVA